MTISSVNTDRVFSRREKGISIKCAAYERNCVARRCVALCVHTDFLILVSYRFMSMEIDIIMLCFLFLSLSLSRLFVHHDRLRSLNVIVLFSPFLLLSRRFSFRCSLRLLLSNIVDKHNRVLFFCSTMNRRA